MPMNPVAPKVIIIPAKQELAENRTIKRQLRVAAYCRVSTDDEEQLTSYEAQQTYYTDKIMTNPDWTMAGIYADEGITGTKATKRPEFLKMIRKCKAAEQFLRRGHGMGRGHDSTAGGLRQGVG